MELLVVIGIIALLIAILMPVLAVAREEARAVKCLSNLRQLGLAAAGYCNTFRGYYPIAQYTAADGTLYCWDFITAPGGGPNRVQPGLLWLGATSAQVQQCPSYDGASNTSGDPYTGYNYNTSFIGHGQGEGIVAPLRVTEVRHPGTVALYGDGQYSAGADKFMRSPFPSDADAGFTARFSGTQGYRHRNRTNVAYCDGHAAPVTDRFTQSTGGVIAPRTGFLSIDNSAYDPN